MDVDVLVVGAGAAGLWAARVAASAGASVLLVEKTGRVGTKILASGGSRCNLTTTLGPDAAARLFGDGARFVTPALRALPPAAVRAWFHAAGVPTVEEPALEKVFPASQRAIDVRDALLREARRAGVELRLDTPVSEVRPAGSGWEIISRERPLTARRLILCAGGRSYPRTGTTGDAYGWLTGLGLRVVAPVPALVPLCSDAAWVRALSGISLQVVEARLLDPAGRVVRRRARPVVFTHHGLSGPAAMDLSEPVARASGRPGWAVALDLLPEVPLEALRTALADAAQAPGAPRLQRVVGPMTDEPLPARLWEAVCRQAGIDGDNPALHQVPRPARNRLVDALKGLAVPVRGTLGWDKAEVTGGGLALDEVQRTTMEVTSRPGLYVCGELLDLTGPIGGLNFQAAFATGDLAGRAAARAAIGDRSDP